ncbi:hypothetical protein QAD02_003702 [Eretmocerus hayati]|uniref:Uncharacterized protein n=1 Tax=Eretmocerus hayati TaxID=131215 RepID=A0ACC2NML3_9HYME|nr:hypothetical protein QAD02_003702 [Eretmocerus hayati]
MIEPECDVGRLTQTVCHSNAYVHQKELLNITDLEDDERTILKFRIEHQEADQLITICSHHLYLLNGQTYVDHQRKCCDPDSNHTKIITANLRGISLCLSDAYYAACNKRLIPGKKLCTNCMKKVNSKIGEAQPQQHHSEPASSSIEMLEPLSAATQSSSSDFSIGSQSKKRLEVILKALDEPPLKRGKLSDDRFRVQALNTLSSIQNKVVANVERSFDCKIVEGNIDLKDLIEKNDSFFQILRNLQFKFKQAPVIREKIEVIALLPKTWTYSDIREYFDCSKHMFTKMLKLRNGEDISRKPRTVFSLNIKDSIREYYLDPKNCHICPGTKECLTVKNLDTGEKEKQQKKLMLHTTEELHRRWKRENPHLNQVPSLTLFRGLRPKECVSAGDPGTHTICVCAQHENVKLKVYALHANVTYRDLMAEVVCDIDNPHCMLQQCQKCPGVNGALQFLSTRVQHEATKQIKFQTWSTKGANGSGKSSAMSLQTKTEAFSEFIQTLSQDVVRLVTHHFIAENQKEFLAYCKQNLDAFTIIVLMDFAENYAFVIQRSVQAWYFNNTNTQATVHPMVVYYKDSDGEVKVKNYCVISDSTQHTAATIYAFQEKFIGTVKIDLPRVENVIYFSDGAPTQYKNKNMFVNICLHKKRFGLGIKSYNFFCTSHGKSPCDGVGAVAKREITRLAIRRPVDEQITNAKQMYEAADGNIKGIKFLWVGADKINATNRKLKQLYNDTDTVHGTRDFHCCIPVGNDSLEFKLMSSDAIGDVIQIL